MYFLPFLLCVLLMFSDAYKFKISNLAIFILACAFGFQETVVKSNIATLFPPMLFSYSF